MKAKTIIIIVIILLLCSSSSAGGYVGWLTFGPKPPDPNGKTLPGYSRAHIMAHDGGIWKGKDMAECRAFAKQLGYPGVGHRNDKHGNAKYKNTCFFYQAIEGNYKGDEKDKVHSIACTDPSNDWQVCSRQGGALAGFTGKHLSPQTKTKHPGNSLEECRALAKKWGHPGVGYRTIGHGSNEWKNTCFSYTKMDNKWGGNLKDKAHVTACTDPTKVWPKC